MTNRHALNDGAFHDGRAGRLQSEAAAAAGAAAVPVMAAVAVVKTVPIQAE